MISKQLTVETTKGTKHYRLNEDAKGGFSVYRVYPGFFGSSTRRIGHGSSIENSVLVARLDAGDSTVTATRLRG